jgi:hypothetical protein
MRGARASATLATTALALALAALLAAPALASFGFKDSGFKAETSGGAAATQAGSHPFAVTTKLDFNTVLDSVEGEITDGGQAKELVVTLPRGFVGEPGAVQQCSNADFLATPGGNEETLTYTTCPSSTAVGVARSNIGYFEPGTFFSAVYNLVPSPGEVQRLGLVVLGGVPVTIDIRISEAPPYNVVATVSGISQVARFYGSELTLWGDPASPLHDTERASCVAPLGSPVESGNISRGSCGAGIAERPLLTLPRNCGGPLQAKLEADTWQQPGSWASASPEAPAMTGCTELAFAPTISARPTSIGAEEPSGFDFSLDIEDEGLTSVTDHAGSDVRKTEVTLPEGFTTNPSVAAGLKDCSIAELGHETASSAPGAGCPQESKIGTVEVETPLLDESLGGNIYIARPYENEAGDSLLGLYMVIKSAKLGISIEQPIKIQPDAATGRLTAIAEEIPQFPFSHFKLHFREGPRAPLTTPAGCGSYAAKAVLTPWSGGPPVTSNSAFDITTGPGGGACSSVGGFQPTFEAGTVDPIAGSYSPFVLKLSRANGTQQLRSIDTTLAPGLLGKLAGLSECPDAQIAAAERLGEPLQGAIEQASPSCPATSEVGVVNVGAGSGALTYAAGHAYLAGPYKGAPLSLAVVTPAVVGPFDLGTVVVRVALYVDIFSAQIHAVSDPLPSILHGIQLDLRSVALTMNRPQFTLNPTSCEPKQILAQATSILGQVTPLSQRFQVGACAALDFKPNLKLSLKGQTKRSGHPALKAVVTYPKHGAYANIASAQVGLPHSEFLDQGNLDNVCTQPQLKSRSCPTNSIYGHAKAWSPLLDKPLEGPVYLGVGFGYSIPALVAELNGQIRVLLYGRVDTDKAKGIRNTFEVVPDAPVSRFVLEMRGGKKYGLLENSEDICSKAQRANAQFVAQNGRVAHLRPKIRNSCHRKKG